MSTLPAVYESATSLCCHAGRTTPATICQHLTGTVPTHCADTRHTAPAHCECLNTPECYRGTVCWHSVSTHWTGTARHCVDTRHTLSALSVSAQCLFVETLVWYRGRHTVSAQCGRVDTRDWYRADTPVPSTDRYDIRLAQRDILVLARSLSWLPHSTNTTRDSVSCPAQYLTDSFTRSPDSPREMAKLARTRLPSVWFRS